MVPEQHPVELDESRAPPNAAPSHLDSIESSEQEGWDFVHFLGSHVESMETRAAIIVPAQLAGAIALWTQLYTFEETIPRTLAWIAWAALIVGLIVAAWITTPGRIRRDSVIGHGLRARPGTNAEALVGEICGILHARVRVLNVGMRVSIGISLLALALVVLAYALDKVFYSG
jgi:hypothetical protein